MTLEIINKKLVIDGKIIGDKNKVMTHLEKSIKYDMLQKEIGGK